MNSAFIFPNSTPISSESGDGGGNGGKNFKGTLKPVSFVTQGFWRSLNMNSAFIFPNYTPISSESGDGDGNGGKFLKILLSRYDSPLRGFCGR